jgi:ABC-type sugar transport system ATPase subunit
MQPQGRLPALVCAGVSKHYGGVRALDDVAWELRPGEVHALCGENGAGKSTLARILAGITEPDSGEILLGGRAVTWSGPDEARRAGIGIILQELDLFANLTVAENIALGNPALEAKPWVSFGELARAVAPFLAEAGIPIDPGTLLGDLSVSHWQLVAIARVLALDAKVILMDEPTSALTDDAVERLFAVIGRLKARGVAIAYVSHKMSEIFRVCDRISVMRDGEMIATSHRDRTSIEEVIQHMVGRPVTAGTAAPHTGPSITALCVRNLSTRKLRGISFTLEDAEILGVAGLVGSGRSEIGRALFGMSPLTGGSILLSSGEYVPRSISYALRRRLVLVPEDRRRDGLHMRMSVRENLTLAKASGYSRMGWIDRKAEEAAAEGQMEQCGVLCLDDGFPVDALSGGNQQKVLLGKWLLARPSVCFLDDPTRGIDVGAKEDIYRLIAQLAEDGVAIVWVSSELPELIANTHRIMVLHEGAIQGMLRSDAATQESIMRLATGREVHPQ